MCVLGDLGVSPAGDPDNRRLNIGCLGEGSWEAGVAGVKEAFSIYPLVAFECQVI